MKWYCRSAGVVLIVFLSACVGRAQVESVDSDASAPVVNSTPTPKTKLEAAATQKNVLVVIGYTDIGETAPGDDGSAVRVTAVEVTNSSTQVKEYGLIVTVHQSKGLPTEREAKCYLDYDELDPLIAAVGDLSKIDHTATTLSEVEARYRTKGELELANISTTNGRMLAIRATQVIAPTNQIVWATARHTLSQAGNFAQFITNGKQTIDRLKAAK
jgi:hypothetical protein